MTTVAGAGRGGAAVGRRRPSRWRSAVAAGLAVWVACAPGGARAADTATPGAGRSDLTLLSVEELMNLQVTTVSRTPQRVSDSPAAVFVITQDDIRRSGFLSLPETLRLAPGMDVARVDGHDWAISARGFNDLFAGKLLVMIDGRSVYTPLLAGVYWDVQDLLMEDVDRIEVVRGPGATMWGANAVNGVVNIITKSAQETQGGLVTSSASSAGAESGAVRYGGKLGQETFYRAYVKYDTFDNSRFPDGSEAYDSGRMGRTGFRIDSRAGDRNALTLQGDAYAGRLQQTYTNMLTTTPYTEYLTRDTTAVEGENLLGRWTHTISDRSDLTLQAYYDRTYRDDPVILREDRQTLDFDLQHRFGVGERQTVIWGAGYRVSFQEVGNTFRGALGPGHRADQLFSAFGQDEINLVDKRLTLTLGSKFEHNDYTGFEIQPSGRLTWTPTTRQTVWVAVSRAERTPSEVEAISRLNLSPVFPNAILPFIPPAVTSLYGNPNDESGQLIAYEFGYRVQPLDQLSFDLAAYYNVYDRLPSIEYYPAPTPGNPFSFIHLFPGDVGTPPANVGVTWDNQLYGETYGGELAANWQLAEWWRWRGAYTFLDTQIHARPGSFDSTTGMHELILENNSPSHQFLLRSSMDLPHDVEWDVNLRYVSALGANPGSPVPRVDGYVTMDVRLAWRPTRALELSLASQNLLQERHAEFYGSQLESPVAAVERTVYGKVTWRF